MTDTFGFCFNGSFQHVGVDTFGKYHTLRIAAGGIIQLTGQFGFISHQFAQVYAICIPVLDFGAGYSAFHSGFGYGTGNFGDKTRVYRFRDEIFRTERKVVYVVGCVYDIRNRLFCQVGDGVYGSNLHFLVDSFGVCVQCAAEDIWETDNIIDLVRIVGTSGCHQYIGAG